MVRWRGHADDLTPCPKGKEEAASVDGLDTVMKVEKLRDAIVQDSEARGLRVTPRIVRAETIERVGRALVALHRPAPFDAAARFGLPPQVRANPTCDSCKKPLSVAEVMYVGAHTDRFRGRMQCYQCQRSGNRAE